MIDVNDYRHLADDAEMIQAAVDDAARFGETAVIPCRNQRTGENIWVLERAVKLHSGSSVCLDGAHLRLADGAFDNLFKNDFARTPEAGLLKNRQHDIRIFGRGNALLDGGRHNGLVERNACFSANPRYPHSALVNTLIHLQNVERVCVENLRIVNARYWGMTFHFCAGGRVSNIHFMTCGSCPNNDGIDLRVGCSDFIIENITGYTQDDTVALTALRDHVAFVEGMDTSIHGVIIRNIASCTRCANVRLLNHYGHKLYNVIIENVQSSVEIDPAAPGAADYSLRLPDCERVNWAVEPPYWSTFEEGCRRAHVCVRIGENGYGDPNDPDSFARLGDTFGIIVRNVQSCAQYGVTLARTLCDSVIENVQMFGDGMIALHVGAGDFDNLRVTNLGFARNAIARPAEWTRHEGNYGFERPCAVVFHHSRARSLFFDGVTTHPCGQDAFGGCGDVELHARHVLLRGENASMLRGEGIRLIDD